MTRASLPNRRLSETIKFVHDRQKYYGTLGFNGQLKGHVYEHNAEPSEIFLDGGRPGSGLQAMCRDFAVVASLAIQHGTPIEVMRKAITRLDDGSPAGPGGKLLDIIAEGKP